MLHRPLVRRLVKMGIDGALAAGAFLMALALRFDGRVFANLPESFDVNLPLVLLALAVATPLVAVAVGTYRALWRFTSVSEIFELLSTSVVVAGVMVALRLMGLSPVPGSVAVIFGVLFFTASSAVRLVRRIVGERLAAPATAPRAATRSGAPVLLIGAGRTAKNLLDHLRTHVVDWNVVGLLDDDPVKRGMYVNGHPVLGATTDLERVAKRHGVQRVVLALPRATSSVTNELIARAHALGLKVQAVPPVETFVGGASAPVTVNDLVDAAEVKRMLLPNVARRQEKRTILVTGGAGYIGSHLVRKLLDLGHHVRVLDNFTFGAQALDALRGHPGLEIMQGDISSIRDVVGAVKDAETVIALAAIVGDPACGLNAEETLNLNFESTKILVEACSFYGVSRLVFASSCSVYGASSGEQDLTEESELNPVSLYARTRILSEQVLFDRCGDMTTTILRLSTVFGLSERMRFDLVVNTLTARAVVDGKFQVFGGDQWRPFVHCQDAAQAFLLAATAPAEKVDRQIFNVGSEDMNYTISQVGEAVQGIVGSGVVMQVENTVDDARNYRVSFDKIRDVLGFQKQYDLQTGIREMVEAIRQNEGLRDYGKPVFSNFKVLQERLEALSMVE